MALISALDVLQDIRQVMNMFASGGKGVDYLHIRLIADRLTEKLNCNQAFDGVASSLDELIECITPRSGTHMLSLWRVIQLHIQGVCKSEFSVLCSAMLILC
jgi:hypothetical protein